MKKSLIAGAGIAALGFAVVPFAGVFAADPTVSITDTVKVTVNEACTFSAGGASLTPSATIDAGSETTFDDAKHEFTIKCNSKSYAVTATASDLTYQTTGDETAPTAHNKFSYTNSYTNGGVDGAWTTTLTGGDTGAAIKTASSTIKSGDATVSDGFSVAYKAYAGTEQTKGTYQGTVVYTLTGSNK